MNFVFLKKLKKFFVYSVLFLICQFSFAQKVISPVPGTFCNKQSLVINLEEGDECFYSFSGSDPLTSGFAYDGPVLIDLDGNVNVKILIANGNSKSEIEINYTVNENNPFDETSENQKKFIDSIIKTSVFQWNGSSINIPKSLKYSFDEGKTFLNGTNLSLDSQNRLSRYLPCLISDGKSLWRFVIFVSAQNVGLLSKSTFPFEISDWNNFTFTGEKLIWCIDDGEWSANKNQIYIDRTKEHIVKWQSVAYETGNTVFSYVIPAEPKLSVNNENQKKCEFFIDGDIRYKMEIADSGIEGQIKDSGGFFTNVIFDTFEGDSVEGKAVFNFYCDGLFQGTKDVFYKIDKKPPQKPVFLSSSKSFYARENVELTISSENDSQIFYAVSKPVKIGDYNKIAEYENDSSFIQNVPVQKFELYSEPITLYSNSESAVFYKVRSFAKDNSNNVSEFCEYTVVIDEFNYYLDSNADELLADGSKNHPFSKVEQIFDAINSSKFTHIFVNGEFTVPEGENLISSDCSLSFSKGSKFIFGETSTLLIRNAGFEGKNIIFEKTSSSSSQNSVLFNLENATIHLVDSEIASSFEQNGNLFVAVNSVLNFENTVLSCVAQNYVCAVNASNSKIFTNNSQISSVADTAINLSLNEGSFESKSSSFKVVSRLGRIAELSAVKISLEDNSFNGEFGKKLRGIEAIWKDKNCIIEKDENNLISGF